MKIEVYLLFVAKQEKLCSLLTSFSVILTAELKTKKYIRNYMLAIPEII